MKNWRMGILVIVTLALCGGAFGVAAYTQHRLRDLEQRLQVIRLEPNQRAVALTDSDGTALQLGNLEERVGKLERQLAANLTPVQSAISGSGSPALEQRVSRIEEHLKPHIELLSQSGNSKR
jgi:hypothetical protein